MTGTEIPNSTIISTWADVANDQYYFATATTISVLDNPIPLSYSGLIITQCDSQLTPTRINNIIQFIQNGRPVYIQCEKDINNSMNQALVQMIATLGGAFSWNQTVNGNIGPLQVLGTFANVYANVPSLNNFYDGCAGSGNGYIFPFLRNNGLDYGFSFCPPDTSYGKIIFTSDTGWIVHAAQPDSDLLHNIFYHLFIPDLCGDDFSPVFNTTLSQTNVTCYGDANGSATVYVNGNFPPFTYLWSPGNQTTASITGLAAGTYICTVTDSVNNVIHDTFIIAQPQAALVATTAQTNILCNGNTTGTATVSPSGGVPSYTYLWSPAGGNNPTATGLAAGSYTCTITDSFGCVLDKIVTLTQPAVLTATTSQTNISCHGANNGTASVSVTGGTPGYTYAWAPTGGNNATATGLTAGNYTCTITDANNCILQQTFNISEPDTLTATISHTDITCFGAGNGTATVSPSGGTPAYTYLWAPTGGNSATATNLSAGTYTCTITDANGCTVNQVVTIVEPASALSATGTQTDLVCNGAGNGLASVLVSGGYPPYTYSWAPTGGNTAVANNLTAGSYTCSITDNNGCVLLKTFSITQPPAIVAAISQANILCHGNNNGIATVLVSGGVSPYTYSWSPLGGNGPNASGLAAGTYTCTITDANNCLHNEVFNISEPTAIALADSQSDLLCFGDNSAFAQALPTGGTPPYSYSWSPSGGNMSAASGLSAGAYTCTVTDHNNCVASAAFNIAQPPPLTAHTSKTNVVCQDIDAGVAIATASGGTPPYNYLWQPGNSTDTIITGLGVGSDTCFITDANGCSYKTVINIVDTSELFLYGMTDSAIDCRSAVLDAIPLNNSSSATSFLWLFDDNTSGTGSPLVHTFPGGGTHSATLIVINAVGCHDTLAKTFSIDYDLSADFTNTPLSPLPNIPVHFHNASSDLATVFVWDFGDNTGSTDKDPVKEYNDSGTYTVCLIASDTNNCADTVCKKIFTDVQKSIGVPSAFSPNGDGVNDVLYVRGYRIQALRLRIYNRWGNLIFETDSKAKGWDGTYKSVPQPEEAYAYTLEATFTDGSTIQKAGSVSLLR
jgi:gliding motility-associated-like protein